MARLDDVLKDIPEKRSLLRIERQNRNLSKSKNKLARKALETSRKGSIPKAKMRKAISEVRKRTTRRVQKR